MKKVKCPCCKRERIVDDGVVISICHICMERMEKVEVKKGVE